MNKTIVGNPVASCRYGENAHQQPATLYSSGINDPLALDKFVVVEGTTPSYNNFCDVDRLLQTITHISAAWTINHNFVPLIAVGGKHGNACGAAVGRSKEEVLKKMMTGDAEAIFGGLVMVNFFIGEDEAEHLAGKMLDGIIAPGFSPEAIERIKKKNAKRRFIVNKALESLNEKSLDTADRFRYVRGGFLEQPNYTFILDLKDERLQKFGRKLAGEEGSDMLLAWAIGSTSNSNTIALVKDGMLIGNGVGQQDRVRAAKLAIERAHSAGHSTDGAVAYSDSFFPFPDGPEVLINNGVRVILTSSGSIKDNLTIELCEKKGVSLFMMPDQVGRGFFGH